MKISRTLIESSFPIDYQLIRSDSKSLTIFLHGYGQHFGFMKKKFRSIFANDNQLYINGIYPLAPEIKDGIPDIKLRFAWYFFNPATKTYFIDPSIPEKVITHLIHQLNLEKFNITFVGFSQGGYLAPFVAKNFKNSKVISINANLRYDLLPKKCDFYFCAINGALDKVVDSKNSKNSFEQFIKQGNDGEFNLVKTSGHLIDDEILDKLIHVSSKK